MIINEIVLPSRPYSYKAVLVPCRCTRRSRGDAVIGRWRSCLDACKRRRRPRKLCHGREFCLHVSVTTEAIIKRSSEHVKQKWKEGARHVRHVVRDLGGADEAWASLATEQPDPGGRRKERPLRSTSIELIRHGRDEQGFPPSHSLFLGSLSSSRSPSLGRPPSRYPSSLFVFARYTTPTFFSSPALLSRPDQIHPQQTSYFHSD
jgi:hypothetical protein